jgi:hypothetical protein
MRPQCILAEGLVRAANETIPHVKDYQTGNYRGGLALGVLLDFKAALPHARQLHSPRSMERANDAW